MANYTKTFLLEDFNIDNASPDEVNAVLKKVKNTTNVNKKQNYDTLPIGEKLEIIKKEVYKTLGRYKGFVKVIYDFNTFKEYIDKAIKVDYIAIDTETNKSLDPLTCKLVGICLYIPNTRPVYVPINHCNPFTEERLTNQVNEEQAREIMSSLIREDRDTKAVYHNGKFDIRVLYNTIGIYLPIWWDTMLAGQLIDENERAALKYQYNKYIDPTIGTYNIEKLFNGVPYEYVDPEVFALYAAIDAYDTYELQQHQQRYFEQVGNEKLYNLFLNIEVPITKVVAQMEDTGITLNKDFVEKLNNNYHSKMDKALNKLNEILIPYSNEISNYQLRGELDNPLNFNSSQQLQIIIYDILKTVSENGERSTDKNALKAMKTDFSKALLEYRHFYKLISSFTESLPLLCSKKDGKIHASFNQMGKEENNVVTGRFSSTDPNLQQIPSHEKVMRLMFEASDGYVIVGGDFKAQEPRMLTHMCGDETLRETFEKGRDPYATLAAPAFHKDYWDCMEFREDGTKNPTGKEWRSKGKVLMLGVMYGMGAKTMSEGLGIPLDECKAVLEDFYQKFPKIRDFSKGNEQMARDLGYVEDYMGRRRHLPDINLPELEFKAYKKMPVNTDVLLEDIEPTVNIYDAEKSNEWADKYYNDKSFDFKKKQKYKNQATSVGVEVVDNGAFISKTLTQCTNSRIQGSAATLTKKAMLNIATNKRLKEIGYRLLIPVHDELLGEVPKEYAEEAEKLLVECMVNAGKPECSVAMGVDTYVTHYWYADEVASSVKETYQKYLKGDEKKGTEPMLREDALNKIYNDYDMISHQALLDMIEDKFDFIDEKLN